MNKKVEDEIRELKADFEFEKRKHEDTANWAMEQQDRADALQLENRELKRKKTKAQVQGIYLTHSVWHGH